MLVGSDHSEKDFSTPEGAVNTFLSAIREKDLDTLVLSVHSEATDRMLRGLRDKLLTEKDLEKAEEMMGRFKKILDSKPATKNYANKTQNPRTIPNVRHAPDAVDRFDLRSGDSLFHGQLRDGRERNHAFEVRAEDGPDDDAFAL